MVNILLVDGDPTSALRNARTLQHAGFHVDLAGPGLEGATLVRDVVVFSMARLGPSMMRVVSEGKPVPRIAISSEERDGVRAQDFDCAAVLVRPVMYDQLVTTVRRVVKATQAASVL